MVCPVQCSFRLAAPPADVKGTAQPVAGIVPDMAALETDIAPEAVPEPGARRDLVGLSREELGQALAGLGLPAFRAKQVWHWIYCRGATDFDAMTTLAKPLRRRLADHFTVSRPHVSALQTAADRTRKWLAGFDDGSEAETVFIPEEDRGALCVSSQVGCTLNCSFCHTGTQPWVRNLSAGEIVGQVMMARDSLDEWPTADGSPRLLSNIVLMGMGEPLYNYDNVVKAMNIVMDMEGIAISRRRITLSTAGVVPRIADVGRDLGVRLAISLHAVTDELRDVLVPLNRRYPIADLLAACRSYPGGRNARRITFEYVMLRGVNDSEADARALVRLVRGIPAKMNLIPFNPWPGAPYECSTAQAIQRFAAIVNRAGYAAPVRTPRGREILAACGQLKSTTRRVGKRARAV